MPPYRKTCARFEGALLPPSRAFGLSGVGRGSLREPGGALPLGLAASPRDIFSKEKREWRGVRWPGHYIIAYLSARAAWSDARELRWTGGGGSNDSALAEREDDGSIGPAELAAVLVGGTLFLQVLGRYGLPDF